MVVSFPFWLPTHSTLTNDKFAEAGISIRHGKDNAIFFPTQWVASYVYSY
jgi:hypothetical protein